MRRYILRRLALTLPIMLGISLIAFALIELAPGDALGALIPPDAQQSPADLAAWRAQLGLDQPAPIRYVKWLWQLLHGNLGRSFGSQEPILNLMLQRLPPTLMLMLFSLCFSTVLGITLGVLTALRQYSLWDYILTVFSFFWMSVPGFFMAMLAIYLFAVKLNLFPAFGYSSPGSQAPGWDRFYHLLLPGVTLGLEMMASLTRYVRSSVLDVIHNDYVRTARAKGARQLRVVLSHTLPNALIPVLTVIGLRLPALFSGAIVVEAVFQWPGMGSLVLQGASARDYPLVMGITLLTTFMVVVSSLLVDIAYGVVDPRIRYS